MIDYFVLSAPQCHEYQILIPVFAAMFQLLIGILPGARISSLSSPQCRVTPMSQGKRRSILDVISPSSFNTLQVPTLCWTYRFRTGLMVKLH